MLIIVFILIIVLITGFVLAATRPKESHPVRDYCLSLCCGKGGQSGSSSSSSGGIPPVSPPSSSSSSGGSSSSSSSSSSGGIPPVSPVPAYSHSSSSSDGILQGSSSETLHQSEYSITGGAIRTENFRPDVFNDPAAGLACGAICRNVKCPSPSTIYPPRNPWGPRPLSPAYLDWMKKFFNIPNLANNFGVPFSFQNNFDNWFNPSVYANLRDDEIVELMELVGPAVGYEMGYQDCINFIQNTNENEYQNEQISPESGEPQISDSYPSNDYPDSDYPSVDYPIGNHYINTFANMRNPSIWDWFKNLFS